MATLRTLAEARVASGRIAGRAIAGENAAAVWAELQAMPDPLAQMEQRRNAEDERVMGFSRTEIARATKAELVQLAQKYRGNSVAAALVRRRAQEIERRERELLGR